MKIQIDPALENLTGAIIGAAFDVSSMLGHGFLEAVYHNALAYELAQRGMAVETKAPLEVRYKGQTVGAYQADLLVERSVVVELKAIDGLGKSHISQVLNYLRATNLNVGLLLNFGTPRLQFRRVLL